MTTGSPDSPAARGAAAFAVVAAAAIMWTWAGHLGPDLLIDFGREAYLAWRLSWLEKIPPPRSMFAIRIKNANKPGSTPSNTICLKAPRKGNC